MIECILENGKKQHLRHVTVSAIAINKQAEVLLIKRPPDAWNGGKWTVPGGFLGRDEDTAVTAARKIDEETGYFGKISLLFQINTSPNRPKEDRQDVDFVYIVDIVGGQPKIDNENVAVTWFPFDKLPPDEDFAFDHRKAIQMYFQYQLSHFPLPIIGSL